MRATVAHVGRLYDDVAAQLPLYARLPTLHIGSEWVRIERLDGVTQLRLCSARRTHRLQDSIRIGVRQRATERHVVDRRNECRLAAEAGLNHVHAPFTQKSDIDPIAAAEHGLGVDRIRQTDARHEVVSIAIPQLARLAVDAGKQQTTLHFETDPVSFPALGSQPSWRHRRPWPRLLAGSRHLDRSPRMLRL